MERKDQNAPWYRDYLHSITWFHFKLITLIIALTCVLYVIVWKRHLAAIESLCWNGAFLNYWIGLDDWFLDHGTLLGSFRSGRAIPHERDVDFGMFSSKDPLECLQKCQNDTGGYIFSEFPSPPMLLDPNLWKRGDPHVDINVDRLTLCLSWWRLEEATNEHEPQCAARVRNASDNAFHEAMQYLLNTNGVLRVMWGPIQLRWIDLTSSLYIDYFIYNQQASSTVRCSVPNDHIHRVGESYDTPAGYTYRAKDVNGSEVTFTSATFCFEQDMVQPVSTKECIYGRKPSNTSSWQHVHLWCPSHTETYLKHIFGDLAERSWLHRPLFFSWKGVCFCVLLVCVLTLWVLLWHQRQSLLIRVRHKKRNALLVYTVLLIVCYYYEITL